MSLKLRTLAIVILSMLAQDVLAAGHVYTGRSKTVPYTGRDGRTWYYQLDNGRTYSSNEFNDVVELGIASRWDFSQSTETFYVYTGKSKMVPFQKGDGSTWNFSLENGRRYSQEEYNKIVRYGIASSYNFSRSN